MKKASVRLEVRPIRTYRWDRPSRYPILFGGGYRFVYPYTMEDRLLHIPEDRPHKQIVLENEYIKVTILPELGGHLWSAYDKVSGKEIFYNNHVVKPGLIALRGAWCATGIEWNFPVGHTVSTVSPVDYALFENEDGSATAVVGDLDRTTRMKWTVKVTVRPGEVAFHLDTILSNPTGYPHRYMYWENAAIHATEGLQFTSPAKVAWTWGGKRPFPMQDGVDKSWYISHPRSIDYFMLGLGQDYFGYYDHKLRIGAVHIADYHLMPGKKFFTWGMAEHALSWQRNLTDDNGPYIELQCGLTPTQASFDFFPPQSARRWDETWYSIGDLGYFVHANSLAAVHISDRFETPPYPDEVQAAVITNRAIEGASVRLTAAGKTLHAESATYFKPGVPVRWKVRMPSGAKEFSLVVTRGREEVIRYSTLDAKKIREMPYDNPGNLWAIEKGSPQRLLRAAIAWLKWFEYKKALGLIDKALKQRPGFVDAHYWRGNLFFDLFKFSEAFKELSKVTPRNANYPMALFLIGQIHRYQRRFEEAREVAAKLAGSRSPARLAWQLAGEVAMSERDWKGAAAAFGKLARGKVAAPHTMALYAVALRKLGLSQEAIAAARRAAEIDPLEYLAANESEISGVPAGRDRVMRGQVESYLELAAYYEDMGLFEEAAAVLEHYRANICKQRCNPLVYYHLGWANEMLGRSAEAGAFYAKAARSDGDHAFPFRREDMLALEAALRHDGGDALAHYLVGSLLAWRHHEDEVMPHWTRALRRLPKYPVLLRNIALYYAAGKQYRKALAFYRRAIDAAPKDEELYVEADDAAAKVGGIAQRIALLEKGLAARPGSQKIRQLLAQAYYYAKRYDDALEALMSKEFDHWEGDRRAHQVFVLSHMDKGKILLKKREYRDALLAFQRATEYPPNLKVGKPAYPRHAPQLYLSAVAYEALGEREKAEKALRDGADEIHEGWEGSASEEGYYKGLCLAQLRRIREAKSIWRQLTRGVEHYGFPAWYNDFIRGLGHQGIEEWPRAVKRLEAALSADRSNSKVRYHLQQARKHRQAGL